MQNKKEIEYIKISIHPALKKEFQEKLKNIQTTMNGWLTARILNFTTPHLFERTFGKNFYLENFDLLIDYIAQLIAIMKKAQNKNFIPKNSSKENNNIRDRDSRLMGIEKDITLIKEKLELLTKSEKLELKRDRDISEKYGFAKKEKEAQKKL